MINVSQIRDLCEKAGISSIRELETRAGLGNGTVARWEEISPRVDTLAKVAKVLGVSLTDLLGDDYEQ